jgi:lysozyme
MMKLGLEGEKLIKASEGLELEAYRDSVNVPTIGWGHTKGVVMGQKITLAQAEKFFDQDTAAFEKDVNDLGLSLNTHQFDALVSFCYNLGPGNLHSLVKGRSLPQIANAIPQYCHAGGEVLPGLVKRRAAEKALFLKPVPPPPPKYPGYPIRERSTNTVAIKEIQKKIGVTSDGVFGVKTTAAVKAWQKAHHLTADGIVGPKTWDLLF